MENRQLTHKFKNDFIKGKPGIHTIKVELADADDTGEGPTTFRFYFGQGKSDAKVAVLDENDENELAEYLQEALKQFILEKGVVDKASE